MDDLHWADTDSLEILDYLTSQTELPPILYIAAYRSEETHNVSSSGTLSASVAAKPQSGRTAASSIHREDISSLVTAFHGPCSQQLVDFLFHRAEGHPLFMVELFSDLITQGLLLQDRDGSWLPPAQDVPIPAFLKQLINQRVMRAGADAAQLLSIASVAGESWQLEIVEHVLGMPEIELLGALESALKADIITIGDESREQYRFSHGLIREVLYTQQLPRKRKRVHEQIALRMEQLHTVNVHAVAYHFLEAERWERAMDYCLAAGDDANLTWQTIPPSCGTRGLYLRRNEPGMTATRQLRSRFMTGWAGCTAQSGIAKRRKTYIVRCVILRSEGVIYSRNALRLSIYRLYRDCCINLIIRSRQPLRHSGSASRLTIRGCYPALMPAWATWRSCAVAGRSFHPL